MSFLQDFKKNYHFTKEVIGNSLYILVTISILVSFIDIISIGFIFSILSAIVKSYYPDFLLAYIDKENVLTFSIISLLIFVVSSFVLKLLIIVYENNYYKDKEDDYINTITSNYLNTDFLTRKTKTRDELQLDYITSINKSFDGIKSVVNCIKSFIIISLFFIISLIANPVVVLSAILFLSVFIFLTVILFNKQKDNSTKNLFIYSKEYINKLSLLKNSDDVCEIWDLKQNIKDCILEIEKKYCYYKNKLKTISELQGGLFQFIIQFSSITFFIVIITLMGEKQAIILLSIGGFIVLKVIPYIGIILRSIIKISETSTHIENISFYKKLNLINKNKIEIDTINNIELKNISYEVDGFKIINNLNILFSKNEKVGIIGSSGSGKSTLVKIILGLIKPTSGEILINGEKIDLYNKSFGEKIGYVSQFCEIIDGDIYENIKFFRDIDKEKITPFIKHFEMENFIQNNIELNNSKDNISGGQKQRISIIRSLVQSPPIIILDEATSALDNQTETKIREQLLGANTNILISIAHRKTSLIGYDKIIKMDNGKVAKIYNNIDEINFDNY